MKFSWEETESIIAFLNKEFIRLHETEKSDERENDLVVLRRLANAICVRRYEITAEIWKR